MSNTFNLIDYTSSILKIAEANAQMSVEMALQCFIANLTTMKEHYKGCPELNYHEIGQQWNKLKSKEKVEQKANTLARLKQYSRNRGKV